jgi:glycosyltransferase involved in cell wall biosynthesis
LIRIGIVSLSAYALFVPESKRRFGGSEVQISRLCRALASHVECEVHLITSGEGPYEKFDIDGVNIIKLPWRPGGSIKRLHLAWQLRREIARLAPDIYLQRCLGIETGLVGQWCKKNHRPFIYMTASDWDCDGTYDQKRPAIVTRYSHRGMRQADLIITQTQRHRRMLQMAYGLDSYVLPSLCNLPEPPPWPRDYWLWVGRCDISKQPHLFLDLAEQYPKEEFLIIAPNANAPWLFDEIEQRASRQPNVTFLAQVPYTDMDQYYRKAKALINTSTQEGFPNVFLEACKHSVPILSLNVNPDDFLTRYKAGQCINGDVTRLLHCLGRWISDKEQLQKLGQGGREYIKKRHEETMITSELLNRIQSLTSK